MGEKQASPNWKRIRELKGNITLQERVNHLFGDVGHLFPYLENFPKTPYDLQNARFGLVVPKMGWCEVEEVEAIVDYSSQYQAEGLK